MQINLPSVYISPIDTRRRFNVYKTSPTSYRRLINVESTSCVYWVRNHLNTILLKMPKIEINFRNSKSEVWIVSLEVPKNEIVQSITQLSVFTHSIFFSAALSLNFNCCLQYFWRSFNVYLHLRHLNDCNFQNSAKYQWGHSQHFGRHCILPLINECICFLFCLVTAQMNREKLDYR